MDTEPQLRTFLLERCLGMGGFGEVYQARMTTAGGLSTQVAIKLLRADVDARSQAVERLRDEGRLLAWLNHPTILDVKDLVNLEGRVALVTEFVPGEDLEHCVSGNRAMPLRAVLEVVGEVAEALDVAWSSHAPDADEPLRLVHRDIKPANIRIGRHGYVKLLDFGIARTDVMKREAHTQTNMLIGSVGYLAPERFLGDEGLSASDVFALGCILFEAGGTGQLFADLPLIRMSAMSVDKERYDAFVDERMAELADQPEAFRQLVREMLAYDPEARPTAKETSRRCEDLAEQVGGKSLSRWAKDRRWRDHTGPAGPLDGRSITEGTFSTSRGTNPQVQHASQATAPLPSDTGGHTTPLPAPVSAAVSAPIETGTSRRTGGLVAGAAAFGVVGIGGVLVLVLVVLAVVLSGGGTDPEEPAAEEARPAEVQPAEVQPAEPAAPPPEPIVEEQPQADAAPVAAPVPDEAVAAPVVVEAPASPPPVEEDVVADVPEEPPAEASPQPGLVVVTHKGDNAVVELRGAAGTFPEGEVPAGSYQVFADFGSGNAPQGQLTLRPGATVKIHCSSMLWACTVP